MDTASIYNLLGWIVVAGIVYLVSTLPPAVPFSPALRVIAGGLALIGVVVFVLHFLQASGVVK